MMKGVKAAVKSLRTPAHLKAHRQNRLSGPSTVAPDDTEPMKAAGRTPEFGGDRINQRCDRWGSHWRKKPGPET